MAMGFDLGEYLKTRQQEVEAALDRAIAVVYPETLFEAMRYSLLLGGKRLRPILCLAACELAGGERPQAMAVACALEMVHTMSLIHDDLPAMDNDDLRRGKPTNHKVYGEAMAILAGDALLAYAFEHAIEGTLAVYPEIPPARLLRVVSRLARAIAGHGLVGGQVVDLASEGQPNLTAETLDFIHTHKTGALLAVSVLSGAWLAGASEELSQALRRYAEAIGLAFQIVDDILDLTGTAEELGKSPGKDEAAQKMTYPRLWGIEASRAKAHGLVAEAKAVLAPYGPAAEPLQALADFVIHRKN
ncbi:MAG: geranylgeranyl diphosphate synthase CrtE [Pseudanabaenaceae cyanobacterium]